MSGRAVGGGKLARVVVGLVAVSTLVACVGDPEEVQYPNGWPDTRQVAALVAAFWSVKDIDPPNDVLSPWAFACIESLAEGVDPDDVHTVTPTNGAVEQAFTAAVFGTCLTHDEVQAYLAADMSERVDLGFTRNSAECMAPGFADLIHEHGLAAVHFTEPPPLADEIESVRLRCGVIGPSRKLQASYVAGVQLGETETIADGLCPGAYTKEQIEALAGRIMAAGTSDEPQPFALISEPDVSPELWETVVDGERVVVALELDYENFSCVMSVTTDPIGAAPLFVP